jgi:hypothetical protein
MGSTANNPDLQGLADSKEARGQYLLHFSEMCCTDRAETGTKVRPACVNDTMMYSGSK